MDCKFDLDRHGLQYVLLDGLYAVSLSNMQYHEFLLLEAYIISLGKDCDFVASKQER